eukprot:scaffold912_cov108-Isochrysis_galbana.AAC.16
MGCGADKMSGENGSLRENMLPGLVARKGGLLAFASQVWLFPPVETSRESAVTHPSVADWGGARRAPPGRRVLLSRALASGHVLDGPIPSYPAQNNTGAARPCHLRLVHATVNHGESALAEHLEALDLVERDSVGRVGGVRLHR